jgi:predicted aconitase with swiveling domain
LTDKILCLPNTIGSTGGGLALQTLIRRGIAPKAFLFSEHIDTLAASGVILSDVWLGRRVITVDQLGREFLEYVKDGQSIEVREDGSVIVSQRPGAGMTHIALSADVTVPPAEDALG